MRQVHRSSGALGLAVLLLACSTGEATVDRTITSHVSKRCAVPDPAAAYGIFAGTGDFEPPPGPPSQDQLFLSATGATLAHVSSATRMLVVDVSDSTSEWRGVAPVGTTGDVNALLWPVGFACPLSEDLALATDRGVGSFDATHVLVTGGLSNQAPLSYVADLSTGRIQTLPEGPLTTRAFATVTAFGPGALLAGGVRSDDQNSVLDSAEVYDATAGAFTGTIIKLSEPRTSAGALALANGDTLLVGGLGNNGVLKTLELVVPGQTRSLTEGLPYLTRARSNPIVLRLTTGEVLVGGGFDGATAIGTMELFSADARTKLAASVTLADRRMAIVALEGGGALVVLATDPQNDGPTFQNVWHISAGFALSHTHVDGNVFDPRLFPGGVLWTGDRWLQWDAWGETFHPLAVLDGPGPDLGFESLAPDPGLAIWLAKDGSVVGRRTSVRHAYTTDTLPLLTLSTGLMSPDSSPSAVGMTFDPSGGLSLPPAKSAFLNDARFKDASIDVDATTSSPPIVVLRQEDGTELQIGQDCPWPSAQLPATMHVEARGGLITTRIGSTSLACSARVSGRFAVGLRGPAVARNLRISR
jgi:hypothetical protein